MVRRTWRLFLATLVVGGLLLGEAPAAAQVATGNLAGTIKDGDGGVIPGAMVTLISQARGTKLETVTNANGDFVFVNVVQDTYTIRVTMDGFKTFERTDVPVSAGDRVALGTLSLQLGTVSDTVTVTSEAPLIQAQSGERSFAVGSAQIENLPVANRSWTSMVGLAAPGVNGTNRLGGAGNNNFQLDGVNTMDTGNNGNLLNLNTDAIAEVKVVTQGYTAEYGRAAGLQISAVSKSGSNQFHGSVFDLRRDSDWNSNSWANARNGIAKAVSKQQDWGYTIGGPVGMPGASNKLFFFYAHQFSPRTTGGGAPNRFRVPTALERQGDFSKSTDNTGAVFNFIRDASTGLTCSATNTAGCFSDGGVLGKIPASRLYPLGLKILDLWPQPNTTGLDYNYEVTPPIDKRTTQQPVVRMDYQMSSKLRVNAKYAGQRATVRPTAGSIPGFNDTLNKFPFVTTISTTGNYMLSPSVIIESTWGMAQNQLGAPIITDYMNRCNVGLCDIPFIYPEYGKLPAKGYQRELLTAMDVPYLVNDTLMLMPTYSWGNRIANAPPNLAYPTFTNINRTHDISASATKVMSRHTVKGGFYWNHNRKAQNLGVAAGANPFQGAINFGNDTNNPLDAGFGFANAALGIFSSYGQQSKIVDAVYIYDNVEFYLQDNWKLNPRLTLDYGLRFIHQTPQYDSLLQASNFFPGQWTMSDAPYLYVPGCPNNANPCATASRQAKNPLTGALLGPGSSPAIGTLVPGTGSPTNGIMQNGQGIAKENHTWPALVVGPRFGAAYDLTKDQRVVLRGSIGTFFDRPDGDSVYGQVSNPPTTTSTTLRYSTMQALTQGGFSTSAAPQLQIMKYDAKIPTTTQWNVGVQTQLPFAMAADVSYVGNHGYNLLQNLRGTQAVMDLNAVDFGAAYLDANRDPTLAASAVPGATALPQDQLRPFRGYAAIFAFQPIFHSTYHSIQASLNRRMRNGVQFGLNYTYSISFKGNAGITGGGLGPGLRLQHAPDGSYTVRADQAEYEKLNENMGNKPHVLRVNGVWSLPRLPGESGWMKGVGYVINDWQLSGVLSASSGDPYDVTFSYNANGAAINLTGSPSYNAKVVFTGDPGSGCSSNPYRQFNTEAVSGPVYNSVGLESGRNQFLGCPDKTVDLAIARNFRLGGGRVAQVRVDMFNAFNAVVYNARATQLQLNSPTDQTVRNPQYNPDGTLVQTRLNPQNAGFGAVTGAQAMRSVQLQLRFQF